MNKFEEAVAKYVEDNEKLGLGLSTELITKVAKGLGPSIYNLDSSRVSGSDQSELDTVKNNYCIKKLGLADSPELDAAVKEAVDALGTSNRNKWRVLVYGLLCKKYGKESIYG